MKVLCINSDSSGNCFYVESDKGTGIFLDAGCPYSQIAKHDIRVAGKYFFVTHEHGDHAKYAKELTDKYGAYIAASESTINALEAQSWTVPLMSLTLFKGIAVQSFPVIHNAAEPCAFYIEIDGESLLYIVDAGMIPDVLHLRPDVLIVEANYTPLRMAENAEKSDTGLYVSGRVSSGAGHLSAIQAAEIAMAMIDSLDLLVFCHISKNNFDMVEYWEDESIPEKVKKNAHLAYRGGTWDSVPF